MPGEVSPLLLEQAIASALRVADRLLELCDEDRLKERAWWETFNRTLSGVMAYHGIHGCIATDAAEWAQRVASLVHGFTPERYKGGGS